MVRHGFREDQELMQTLAKPIRLYWHPLSGHSHRVELMLSMLGLPFEHVLVSHGEPVHTRADFEAALERKPWGEVEG